MSDCIPNAATLTMFVDLAGKPEDPLLVSVRFALVYGTQESAVYFQQASEKSDKKDPDFFIKRSKQKLLFVGTSKPVDSSCMPEWKKNITRELIALMEKRAIQPLPDSERGGIRDSLDTLLEPHKVQTPAVDIPFTALDELFDENE